jgi:hypothetical protein
LFCAERADFRQQISDLLLSFLCRLHSGQSIKDKG